MRRTGAPGEAVGRQVAFVGLGMMPDMKKVAANCCQAACSP